MIETRYLYYFLAVARELNITRAAESLHITQPTLSKQMMDLEDMLGCALFERNRKKLELTSEGLYLQARAQEIVELLEKTEAQLMNKDDQISGEINLGAAETPFIEEVIKVYEQMKQEYPHIRLNIYSADADNVMERLDSGLCDIGLMLSPRKQEKYKYETTHHFDEMCLVMRKDDPLADMEKIPLAMIYDLPLIMPRRTWIGHHSMGELIDMEKLDVTGTFNMINNAAYMVKAGNCYAFTTMRTDKEELVYRSFEPSIRMELFVVTRKYQTFSPAVKMFLDRLSEHFRENA
ncbi:MAG: LysR family transcriptional regulator [Erysipelotrichaceae bacterium]|nr:LysR family transcriptional regulator [Erysipelotrichaceae bacterium]